MGRVQRLVDDVPPPALLCSGLKGIVCVSRRAVRVSKDATASIMATWWREPDMEVASSGGCAAERTWASACAALRAPDADRAWQQITDASPTDEIWHSLRNCVAYQAGVWQTLVSKGIAEVVQPAAFKLALVLRHTPPDLAVKLLADLLRQHPQSQDLTSYILALLTDDEASTSYPQSPDTDSPSPPPGPAPLRDLQLFGDCELAVLAAGKEQYDAQVNLIRAEYAQMTEHKFVELRIKVLNQLSKIPKLFRTPEFEPLEATARDNIKREIGSLKEQMNKTKTS